MSKYRILSLDGGGSWSVFQVMALQSLYGDKERGHDVLKRFDLVAANGGGSVILAGLAMNMTLQETLERFFLDPTNRTTIFGATRGGWPWQARWIIRLEALKTVLGKPHEHTLGILFGIVKAHVGVSPVFLICAFDCDRRRPEFFRSNLSSASASSTGSWDPSLAEVIHASVTSPVQNSDALVTINGTRFCDGTPAGLYNPVLAAVTEARANRWEAKDIQVLSIGSGTIERPVLARKKKKERPEVLDDIAKRAFDDPPCATTYMAHVALGQDVPTPANPPPISNGSIVRLSPVIRHPADPTGIGGDQLVSLARINRCAFDEKDIEIVKRYGQLWIGGAVKNEAIRANREFVCEIGHDRFPAARDAWWKLVGQAPTAKAEGAPTVAA